MASTDRSFDIGSIRCTVLHDGNKLYEPDVVFANAPNDVWAPLVARRLDDEGSLPLPYQPVLLDDGGETVLVDAGTGPELAAWLEEPVGKARAALEAHGVRTSDVDVVVISHAHPDHIGGLTESTDDAGGSPAPVFANARHVIARTEWEYWHSKELSGPSADMAPISLPRLDALDAAGLLELVEDDAEVRPGIRTLATPGHTPGHTSVLVSSGVDTALIAGDAIMTEWSFARPDWFAEPEVDPKAAVATRTAVLERAVAEDLVVTAYHVPGIGRVRRVGNAFDLVPI